MNAPNRKLGFYITPEHPCSYLSNKQAITLFADPAYPKNGRLYTILAQKGFRRSGNYLYQPYCTNCSACVPVRISVNEFQPRRKQKRAWKINQDLSIRESSPVFNKEHYELYKKYIAFKHPKGGMENHDTEEYMKFLTADWMSTVFFEIKIVNKLIAVAVVDCLDNGLSAVYTFYEPSMSKRSLGIYSILFEIEETKRRGLEWLYLGYWIKNCSKMDYKQEFQPLDYYYNNQWQRIEPPFTP